MPRLNQKTHSRHSNVLDDTGSRSHGIDIGQNAIKAEGAPCKHFPSQRNDRGLGGKSELWFNNPL